MKPIVFFSLIAGLLTFSACDSNDGLKPGKNPVTPPVGQENGVEKNIFQSPYSPAQPIELNAEQKQASSRVEEFSWQIFAKVLDGKEESNMLLSPLSLVQNMMVLMNGTSGQTQHEIMEAVGLDHQTVPAINAYVRALNQGLHQADARTQFRTNNSVWYQNQMTLKPSFKQNITSHFSMNAFPALMNDATKDSINAWAEQNTYGRIKNLLSNLNLDTKAVLVNTVYFRGLWADELLSETIRQASFQNASGNTESARLVPYHCAAPYAEGEYFQFTSRPFGNGAFVMDFVLPCPGVSPRKALLEYMDMRAHKAQRKLVELDFPIFKSASELELNDLLQSIGINRLFQPSASDELCMFSEPATMNKVIQKTSIAVCEKGTEAAAATYEIMTESAGDDKLQRVEMHLSRPFFYTIRETSTNTCLFMGYQASLK